MFGLNERPLEATNIERHTMSKRTPKTIARLAGAFIAISLLAGCGTLDSGAKDHPYTAKAQHKSAKAKPESKLTPAQQNAIGAAQDYLTTQHFSKAGLVSQLSSKYGSQFKKPLAIWAVNHIKVNWNTQAVGAAKDYLNTQHFSRQGLIDQLTSSYGSQFTLAQATYAVNHVGL